MAKKSRYLVCTAWPYVQATPHLGNILNKFAGDAFTRFFKLLGHEVLLVSGSDQHGSRMDLEASRLGITPQILADKNHKLVKELLTKFDLSYNQNGIYSYTQNPTHIKFCQDFYNTIYKKGLLIKKEETRLFCEKDKKFLADRFVIGTCPFCNNNFALGDQCDKCGRLLDPLQLKNPHCAFCQSTPIKKQALEFYFDLPKFDKQLRKYIDSKKDWQVQVKNFSQRWLNEGLKPRAITRESTFGIPVTFSDQDAKNKTIYVWAEAVLGYISTVVELQTLKKDKNLLKKFWQDKTTTKIFCLGKDNIPFHSILLPALILAEGNYTLPDYIYSNEYITDESGEQFSKKRGIGIWLDEALELLPADYWRFYLFSIYPQIRDAKFGLSSLTNIINTKLIGNFSNFISRTFSLLDQQSNGKVPKVKNLDKDDKQIQKQTKKIVKDNIKNLYSYKLKTAIENLQTLTSITNKKLQKKEPWKNKSSKTLFIAANLIKTLAFLSYPFIPSTATKLLSSLNIKLKDNYNPKYFYTFNLKTKIKNPGHLFQKQDEKQLKEKLDEIRNSKMKTTPQPKSNDSNYATLEDLQKLKIKVGKVISAEEVKDSQKLLKFKLSFANGESRTIFSAIKGLFEPKDLIGKKLIVTTGLQPKKMMNENSEGMILMAEDDSGKLSLLIPEDDIAEGSKVH